MEIKLNQPWFLDGNVARYKDINFKDGYIYDYRLQILLDIYDYCQDNNFDVISLLASCYDQDIVESQLYDLCLMSDSVTGNPSGSYWFSQWYADNALCHNWDLVVDAFYEFDDVTSVNLLDTYPEQIDVKIRCYLLAECVHVYVSEIIRCYVEN